jgi:hypothetical protein
MRSESTFDPDHFWGPDGVGGPWYTIDWSGDVAAICEILDSLAARMRGAGARAPMYGEEFDVYRARVGEPVPEPFELPPRWPKGVHAVWGSSGIARAGFVIHYWFAHVAPATAEERL